MAKGKIKKAPAAAGKKKAITKPKKSSAVKTSKKKVAVKAVKKSAPKKKIVASTSTATKGSKGSARKTKKPKRKPETLMCFLTTACVNYYALPDDGYELNTLRQYRDGYLASSPGGKKLIKEYYKVSPGIVNLVEKDPEKKSVYAYIYSEVKTACSEIEKQNLLSAKKVYTNMVNTLLKRYRLN